MERDVRYIKKKDYPTLQEIQKARDKFKNQLVAKKKNYDFEKWIFHFNVGDVFEEIYKEKEKDNKDIRIYTKDKPFFEFDGGVNFSGTRFEVDTFFSYIVFREDFNFNSASFVRKANFMDATFRREADFMFATFGGEADFKSATFVRKANFMDATFRMEADFMFATFGGEADFWDATFVGEANFSSISFGGKANFWSATFCGEANFWSATFVGEASFSSATFGGNADFTETIFKERVCFIVATIKENAVLTFIQTQFGEKVSFNNCNQKKKVIHKLGIVRFRMVSFYETISFVGAGFQELVFENCLFEKQLLLPKEKDIANPNREFFRIAKHEALKVNNQIEAHTLYVKEMQAYEREPITNGAKILDKIVYYGNLINLKLNKYSTYYGSRWWQGVIFIVFMVHLFLLQDYIGDYEIEYPLSIVKHFYHIVPLNFSETANADYTWGYFLMGIFARIMVIYGVYQTVAAFRRLGKF